MTVPYRIDPEAMSFAFVRVPLRPMLYVRTHVCVVFVACTRCKAKRGTPCVDHYGLSRSGTHVVRRKAYAEFAKKGRR